MRRGFTLVELVIVILLLGILGAVAAPRMFDTTGKASDNSVRQSLAVVREAIQLYEAQHRKLPGANGDQATFKADIAPYVRKFPVLPVGPASARDDEVVMDGATGTPAADSSPNEGWRYYFNTGTFIVNSDEQLASDNSLEYDDL